MNEKEKKVKTGLIVAVVLLAVALIAAIVAICILLNNDKDNTQTNNSYYNYNVNKDTIDTGASKKKTDDSNADTIENVINNQLQNYTYDDRITAVADTDDDMTAYTRVADIIDAADDSFRTNNYDGQFENMVKENIPAKYYRDSDAGTEMLTKQDGFDFWVLITGTKEKGYSATVKCAKEDPFDR